MRQVTELSTAVTMASMECSLTTRCLEQGIRAFCLLGLALATQTTVADSEGSLVAYGADQPIGFELCGAEPASCRYASAVAKADRVELAIKDATTPTRVRFCWADSPVCTLYDESGLPAGPFEMAIE